MSKLWAVVILLALAGCDDDNTQQIPATPNISYKQDQRNNVQDYYYAPAIASIYGTVVKKAVDIQHTYDDPARGKKDTIYVLGLKKRVNVLESNSKSVHQVDSTDMVGVEPNPTEMDIDSFQLRIPKGMSIEAYVGLDVQVTGSFYHASSAKDHTDVLLSIKEIKR